MERKALQEHDTVPWEEKTLDIRKHTLWAGICALDSVVFSTIPYGLPFCKRVSLYKHAGFGKSRGEAKNVWG